MEHAAPRQNEITLESISLDDLPVVKLDIFYFLMLTAVREVPDEEAERYLIEAVEAGALARELLDEIRQIEKPLRRLYRAGLDMTDSELADLQHVRLRLLVDAMFLEDSIRRSRIGRYFSRTRHRLTRQLQYVLSVKHERSLRKRKEKPSDKMPADPAESIQSVEPLDNNDHDTSSLRKKIYNFRNSYGKK